MVFLGDSITEQRMYTAYIEAYVLTRFPDWKVRFRENSGKMRSGNLLQAAEVLKGLLQLHADKPLSFREKQMLERARHMLLSEVSMARGVPEIHAAAMLQRALTKAGLTLPAPT